MATPTTESPIVTTRDNFDALEAAAELADNDVETYLTNGLHFGAYIAGKIVELPEGIEAFVALPSHDGFYDRGPDLNFGRDDMTADPELSPILQALEASLGYDQTENIALPIAHDMLRVIYTLASELRTTPNRFVEHSMDLWWNKVELARKGLPFLVELDGETAEVDIEYEDDEVVTNDATAES